MSWSIVVHINYHQPRNLALITSALFLWQIGNLFISDGVSAGAVKDSCGLKFREKFIGCQILAQKQYCFSPCDSNDAQIYLLSKLQGLKCK